MLERRLIILSLAVFMLAGCQSLNRDRASEGRTVILVTPNLDDDDGDGEPDAADDIVNGPLDRDDLTVVHVPGGVSGLEPRFLGSGADLYRILDMEESASGSTAVWIEAKGPKSASSKATLVFHGGTVNGKSLEFHLDIKPFMLTSSVDRASEVFMVRVPDSETFIKDLESLLSSISNAPQLTVLYNENGSERDVWIQDATEIGFFKDASIFAALAGLRAKHNNPKVNAKLLDRYFVKVFCGPNRCVLGIGEPLAERRWIDWFGNLESTPPFVGANGREYPWGRILTGQQRELSMHDSVMEFLEAQGAQWPPIVLDTGFLAIGHIDEIVNFIPHGNGFKVVMASPALGRQLLEELAAEGHGEKVLLKGKSYLGGDVKGETTIAEALESSDLMGKNDKAAKIMKMNRNKLMREMCLKDSDIVDLPVVITARGWTLWPNPVNGLVLGTHYVAPKPFGPMIDNHDPIEEVCRVAFSGAETTVHFLDVFDAYSSRLGEVHCGTNAVRHRRRP